MLMARRRVQAAKNMKAEAQTIVSAPVDQPATTGDLQVPVDGVASTELTSEQPKAKAKGKQK